MFNTLFMILVVALALIILSVLYAVGSYVRVVSTAPQLRPVDVSYLETPPLPALRPVVDRLIRLGFRRVGEAGQAASPSSPGMPQIWYFTDQEGTTCAGVFAVGARVHAVIYSWFGQEAVIVTAFPAGEMINEPNFRFHVVTTSIEDAYHHHLEQLPDFEMRYGPPTRLDHMAEILSLDAVYNAKFVRRRFRPTMWRNLSTPIFQAYLVFVLLGALVAMQEYHVPAGTLLAGLAVLMLPAAALFVWLRRKSGQRGG
jgi:hypothetical protein